MSLLPLPEGQDDMVYLPDPMGRWGQGRWAKPRRAFPEFDDQPEPSFDLSRIFDLGGSVGRQGRNDGADVAKVEQLLIGQGYLDQDGPTGYWGMATDDAARRFQKDHGLKVDGQLNPGGETIGKLREVAPEAEASEAAPGQGEVQVAFAPAIPLGLAAASVLGVGATIEAQKHQSEIERWFRNKFGDGPTAASMNLPPKVPQNPGIEPAAELPKGVQENPPTNLPDRTEFPSSPPADSRLPPPVIGPQGEKEQLLSDEQLAKEFAKPLENSRGDATTQKGNDIVARSCVAVLNEEYLDLKDIIKHQAGAT